jgi:hypothetical protein
MTKTLLVSDPGPDGESQQVIYCTPHLEAACALAPLSTREYVLQADDDVDCEECRGRARTPRASKGSTT